MAQPPEYERQYSFRDWQTANPVKPLPGDQVDAELNAVKQTADAICANLALIQRDDGALANLSVGAEQLKADLNFGVSSATLWGVGIQYYKRAGVWVSNKFYIALVDHVSTVFATDLAAGRWGLIVDFDPYVGLASASAASATASATAAANSYDAFDDRYLGSKAADPTLDNDGAALLNGALYFNTGTSRMRVYNGSVWADIQNAVTRYVYRYNATAGQTVFTGVDVNGQVLSFPANTLVAVFQQGLRKAENTWSGSGGNTITLAIGATLADVIQIEVLSPIAGAGTMAAQTATNVDIQGGRILFTKIRTWHFRIAFTGNVSALTDALVFTAPGPVVFNKMRVKTSAGTCDVTLKKGASAMAGATAVGVTTTPTNSTITTNNTFAANDLCNITIANISSATDLEIWIDADLSWS